MDTKNIDQLRNVSPEIKSYTKAQKSAESSPAPKAAREEPVVTDVKPEVATEEEAQQVQANILNSLKETPTAAVDASGNLNESRVMDLLKGA